MNTEDDKPNQWMRAVPLFQDHVDTDRILPAQWLSREDPQWLAQGCFSGSDIPFWKDPPSDVPGLPRFKAVLAGTDFGCGSSREHAVWALQAADVGLVVATSFARIFRRNAVNCGLVPAEILQDDMAWLAMVGADGGLRIHFDSNEAILHAESLTQTDKVRAIAVNLAESERILLANGGWLAYALSHYE